MSTSTTSRPAPWAWLLALSLCLLLLVLAGCTSHAPGELGRLQQINESCPDHPLNSHIQLDGSGSGQSADIEGQQLGLVKSVAERTAVCDGFLTVAIFSAGSGATITLFSGDLTLNLPTENAKLRRVDETVSPVVEQVSADIGPARASLPGGGSDIGSSYRLMGEQALQLPDAVYEGYLYTDGLSNLGALQVTGALSPEQAQALAAQVPVPTLPASSRIVVAGLGRVAGDPVPSQVIEGMVSLYDALCARTGASACTSVTDYR